MNTTDLLREHLQDRTKTDRLVSYFVHKAVEEQKRELVDESNSPDFVSFYETQLRTSAQQNVKVIYANAESPIEPG